MSIQIWSLILLICCTNALYAALPKSEVRDITEEYILYITDTKHELETDDFDKIKPWVTDLQKNRHGFSIYYRHVKIKDIDGNTAELILNESFTGYIVVTDDGKIKYDCIYNKHPIHSAILSYANLYRVIKDKKDDESSIMSEKSSYEALVKTGVPTFDYSLEADRDDKLDALDDLKDWLRNNGETWSNDDPKQLIPRRKFKELKDSYL